MFASSSPPASPSSSSSSPPPLTSASSSESVNEPSSPPARMHLSLPPPAFAAEARPAPPTPKPRAPKRGRVPIPPAWAADADADDEADMDVGWPSFARLRVSSSEHTHSVSPPPPARPPLGSRRSTAMPPTRTRDEHSTPRHAAPRPAEDPSTPPLFTSEDAAALASPPAPVLVPRPVSLPGAPPSFWEPSSLPAAPSWKEPAGRPAAASFSWTRSADASRTRFDDMADRSSTDWRALPSLARFRPPPPSPIPSRPAAPPEPPRVLSPPPRSSSRASAHERFLAPGPPAPGAGIAVDALPGRYRVRVHLPGVPGSGVTVSTRARQTLLIAADGYEAGGGHFERRVQFGPDADLRAVSAAFDAGVLDLHVPRREVSTGGGWRDWAA